jgi:hypothetical protein
MHAAVLRTTSHSCGNIRFSNPSNILTPSPIDMKHWTVSYSGTSPKLASLVRINLLGVTRHTYVKYIRFWDFFVDFFFFITAQAIFPLDGSNGAERREEVPFGGSSDNKLHQGV